MIYVRQSKDSERSVSPENQEAACRKLAAVAACERVTVFKDLGISGGQPPAKRPGFLAMRERILASDPKREPLVIAAYDQSRFSRSNEDSAAFFGLLETRPWVDLVMVDGHFERSPSGEFTWAMMAATATHLRKLTGKKIKAAYASKNAQGIPTGPAPYGYRYVGGKRDAGALEIDPDTAPIVRRVFEDYASGDHSTATIAEALTAEGVAPPERSKRAHWMGDSIGYMLANVAYIGKTYSESRLKRKGDLIPATWEPLIGGPLFQRVQDRLKAKRPSNTNGGPTHARAFVFRGLLYCSQCRRRLTAQHTKAGVYYRCGSYELPAGERCALALHAIREEELTPWMDRIIAALERDSAHEWLGRDGSKVDKVTAAEAIEKIDRKIKRTGDRYAEEELTKDEYRNELARLRRQRDAYAAMAADEPDPKELAMMAQLWKAGDAAQRWTILNALFERIHIEPTTRKIRGYTPRMDRVIEVKLVLAIAFGYPPDGPGADRVRDAEGEGFEPAALNGPPEGYALILD